MIYLKPNVKLLCKFTSLLQNMYTHRIQTIIPWNAKKELRYITNFHQKCIEIIYFDVINPCIFFNFRPGNNIAETERIVNFPFPFSKWQKFGIFTWKEWMKKMICLMFRKLWSYTITLKPLFLCRKCFSFQFFKTYFYYETKIILKF